MGAQDCLRQRWGVSAATTLSWTMSAGRGLPDHEGLGDYVAHVLKPVAFNVLRIDC